MARRAAVAMSRVGGVALACTIACGDAGGGSTGDDSSTGAPDNADPHVTLEAVVDVFERCGPIGSKNLSFRATRVGCEQGPPAPCTLPKNPYETVYGDTRSCENPTETAARLYLDVESSGRYLIEVVTITETGEVGSCYGLDGEVETLLTSAQLEARETVMLSHLGGGPCPGP